MKKVGYLGPKKTYTESALDLYLKDVEKITFPNIASVFDATAKDKVELGFVPIENIIEGPVTQTLDNLLIYHPKIKIVGATLFQVRHAIGALPGAKEIKKIMSKDTALWQCSNYLNKNYPSAEQKSVDSTSYAMEEIARHNMLDVAAIGMESAFEEYGLEIFDRNIGNVKNNKTRFILLGQEDSEPTGKDITTIAIYPQRDKVGILEAIIKVISRDNGLNMSSIHSRPDGKGLFKFYFDIEGHQTDDATRRCISSLRSYLGDELSILSSYPHLPFNEALIKTIGVIGGTGKMGKWFDSFYTSKGYSVLIAGRDTPLTYEECVSRSDVVIINVPIEHTENTIRMIGPMMGKGQLLVDNTGVKTKAVKAMLEYTSPEVEVMSIHTMFGDKTESIANENIISIHTKKTKEIGKEFENIFYKYGANITKTTPQEHDMNVVLTQGLEHLIAVTRLSTKMNIAGHPSELDNFSTPNSRISEVVDGRIHSGNPELFATMMRENPHVKEILTAYATTVVQIVSDITADDTSTFEKTMEENKQALGAESIAESIAKSKDMLESIKTQE